MPLISVIVPARNSEATIAIALQSILDQTYKYLEIIVVDDNSTDATRQIVEGFSMVRYLALPFDDPKRCNRRGVNVNAGWMARNYGIDHAAGEWITFQDADDASLCNRIEVQVALAQTYHSNHVCINWQRFDETLLGSTLDAQAFLKRTDAIFPPKHMMELARQTKGWGFSMFKGFHRHIPFTLKRRTALFFRSWDPYPYAGNSPLVKRHVFDHVRFRPLAQRIWPSDRGRGADRDFNFQVAEKFQNSICANVPLYLWRVTTQNPFLPSI